MSRICLLLVGVAMLSSCTDNIFDRPKIEDYTKSYMTLFGEIDPNQDWNMAERKSITVDAGGSNVKIYAKSRAAYTLVGDYDNVSGTQDLEFDAAKGVNDFVVMGGGTVKMAKNGETVSLNNPASRVYYPTNGYITPLEVTRTFPVAEILPFLKYVPEGEDSRNNPSFHSDFVAASTEDREVTIYPVYWNASFYHEFGIYYIDANGNKYDEKVVWRNKDDQSTAVSFDYYTLDDNGNRIVTTYANPKSFWTGSSSNPECINGENTTALNVHSKGFKVTVPVGKTYGFFIKAYNKTMSRYIDVPTDNPYDPANLVHTWYTEQKYNYDGCGHASFFETLVEKNGQKVYQTFLGFEDTVVHAQGADKRYPNSGYTPENGDSVYNYTLDTNGNRKDGGWKNDRDYNDLMFVIDPAPVIIDHSVQDWILAAEDLGTEDDFDFNDLVVGVKHVAGQSKATIKGLAAGGTLPLYFYLGDHLIGDKEYHEAFFNSLGPNRDGLYGMINTYGMRTNGNEIEIDVDPNFSLTTCRGSYMGGFNIVMHDPSDETGKGQTVITPPHEGEAPQMICVPYNWRWPKERVRIDGPYPLFGEWGETYTNAKWLVEENFGKYFSEETIARTDLIEED